MALRINADLDRPAVVDGANLDWRSSPAPGVERRMLERNGDEVARLTSIVRYAPGSEFPAHTHGGGEEFLVIHGTFADEHGAYPAGMYVRNPVGSSHAPRTPEGSTIFVKLHWMHPPDQEFVRVDTTRADLWEPTGQEGVDRLPLHRFGGEETFLLRLAQGCEIPERAIPGGEELFVLAGRCDVGSTACGEWTWVRHPAGEKAPRVRSAQGCVLYVKRGHLKDPPPPPTPTDSD